MHAGGMLEPRWPWTGLASLLASCAVACGARSELAIPPRDPLRGCSIDPGIAAPPQPSAMGCDFDAPGDSGEMIWAAVLDGTLFALTRGGAVVELHAFHDGAPLPPGLSARRSALISAGGWILAAFAYGDRGPGTSYRTTIEVALVRTDTRAVTTYAFTLQHAGSFGDTLRLFGRREGLFAITYGFGAPARTHWLLPGGRVIDGPADAEAKANGSLHANGALFAAIGPRGSTTRDAWIVPCDAHEHAPVHGGNYVLSTLGTMQISTSERTLLVDDDARTTRVLLGTESPIGWLYPRPDGPVLIGAYDRPNVATWSPRRGLAGHVPLIAPSGQRPFGDTSRWDTPNVSDAHDGFGIASNDVITMSWRDDAEGAVYGTLDGAVWTRLSPPWRDIWTLRVVERAGTYVFNGSSNNVRPPVWGPPRSADALRGPGLAWARPGDSTNGVLSMGEFVGTWPISSDGRCVYRYTGDGVLRVVNARTARERRFDVLPTTREYAPPSVWLPDDLDAVD